MKKIILPLLGTLVLVSVLSAEEKWKKHVVHEGERSNVAVAADFTGDGQHDVISNSGGKTRLFVAPDWRELIIDDTEGHNFIHGEVFDVDRDGDLDFIGARYSPGLVVWLECPDKPTAGPWKARIADDELNGIHGLLKGDVDLDGQVDLLANSGQPVGKFANSAAWLKVPKNPRQAKRWERHIFANGDAPGLSHYLGYGDINGDGRPDIAMGAKGGPQDKSGMGEWFAWWEAPQDPTQVFKKHSLPGPHPGATNIQQADINGDGKVDLLASRGHGQGLIWFENPSWKVHTVNAELVSPHCLQVLDMDDDGDIDAATCAYESQVAAWFENDGKGNFTTHVVAKNQAAYDIRAVDMDRDRDLDLLIAGQNSNNVVWYENPRLDARASVRSPDEVFLLIGQSNMAGRAALEPEDREPIKNCLLWNGTSWEPAAAPFNRFSTHRKAANMQRLNMGPSFARAYLNANSDVTIGIICWARGGTSLEQWHPDHKKPYDLYDAAVGQTHAALKSGGKLVGILWHQGEANRARVEQYPALLKAHVQRLRMEFDNPRLPFVCGQIGQWNPEYAEFNKMLVQQPDNISRTGCASTEDLTNFDNAHFDRASQLEFGKRYAEQMLILLAE